MGVVMAHDNEWIPVISNNLRAVWHDCNLEVLLIEFKDGSIYLYADRHHWLFEKLLDATSKGKFANRYIFWNEPRGIKIFDTRPKPGDRLKEMLEASLNART